MARSHYSYEKRQLELKKKKKHSETSDDAAEYLAMLRGEPMEEESEEESEGIDPEETD